MPLVYCHYNIQVYPILAGNHRYHFESVDGEVQRRSEGATLCVCGPGESLRQGAKRRGVVLHEKVWIGREVRENSTRYV